MPKGYKPAGSGRKAQEEGNPLRITVCTTVSPAHIAAIEVARGEQDRATWIRAAILRELDRTNDGKETREMQTFKVWAEVNGRNIFAGDRRAKNAENALRAQAKIDSGNIVSFDAETMPGTVYAICQGGVVYKTDISDAS
jgi:hypothetical protein